jgi:D-alanyl-D-alanine carboxypeptidase/D-alanyl-D-alanine-endopeptidase (penicillin-binding protein 4)
MVNPNWPEEQLLHWYCAQVTGIAFNDNCLDVYPQANGSYRTEPDASFLHINNKLLKGHNQPVNLNRKFGGNEFTFTGGVATNSTEPMTVTRHDPAAFFGQVLAHRLIAEGINVGSISRPEYNEQLPKGTTLITYSSKLPEVIHRCNRDSQNLFAECLIKRIGAKVTGQPGSWENGAAAVTQLLQQKLGPHFNGVQIIDGSGMSKENRVTARAIVGLLHMMAADPKTAEPFRSSLAIAGVDGTLKKRFKDQLRGRFFGKTGFINGVSSLSGYILVDSPKGNQLVAISMVFNGFKGTDFSAVRHLQEQLIEMTYDRLTE